VAAPRSLRLELVATLAVVLMMAAVSLSLATELLGGRRHAAQQRARLAEHAQGLAVIAGPVLHTGGSAHGAQVEQVLRPSLGTLGITTIEIHRAHGDASGRLLQLGLPADGPELALRDGMIVRSVRETADGQVVVDEPIRAFAAGGGASTPLVLRIIARPAPWTREGDWTEIAILALGVGGVLLLLGFVLVDVQVLRPLRAVQRGVEEVGRGNLETRVPTDGPREFHQLGDAFNAMTASLRAQLEQIEAQRARLVRSEQLATVGRIAAGTAHEIGNPLAAILGYVELLLDPRTDPPLTGQPRELLERTRTQLTRIQTTIGQLLDYSRPSKGHFRRLDVADAVRRLLALLRHDPRATTAELTVRVRGDEPVEAYADAALLDQIVQNLVVNACRAASDAEGGPRVVVELSCQDDVTIVDVADNGPGVGDDNRERLFEPFFTTAKAGEGTGLGLAVSQGLAEGMDGTLELRHDRHEEGLGGAVFRLTLPRRTPASEC
jgi:signal transduction histidine kinase